MKSYEKKLVKWNEHTINSEKNENDSLERPSKRRKENKQDEEFWQFRDEQQLGEDNNNYSVELDRYLKDKVLSSSDILHKWDEFILIYMN